MLKIFHFSSEIIFGQLLLTLDDFFVVTLPTTDKYLLKLLRLIQLLKVWIGGEQDYGCEQMTWAWTIEVWMAYLKEMEIWFSWCSQYITIVFDYIWCLIIRNNLYLAPNRKCFKSRYHYTNFKKLNDTRIGTVDLCYWKQLSCPLRHSLL